MKLFRENAPDAGTPELPAMAFEVGRRVAWLTERSPRRDDIAPNFAAPSRAVCREDAPERSAQTSPGANVAPAPSVAHMMARICSGAPDAFRVRTMPPVAARPVLVEDL